MFERKVYWTKAAQELSNNQLLQEHRTLHAYFVNVEKQEAKILEHTLYGCFDPMLAFVRHQENAIELTRRSLGHISEVKDTQVELAMYLRNEFMVEEYGAFLLAGDAMINVPVAKDLEEYARKILIVIKEEEI